MKAVGEIGNFPRPRFPGGKQGMMDDFFDFMFTVIAGFFILMFLGFVLNGAAAAKEQAALSNVGKFNAEENLVFYLHSSVDEQNMADLIKQWYYHQEQLEEKLVTESEKVLKEIPTPHSNAGWNVRIYSSGNEELVHIMVTNILGDYENRNSFTELVVGNQSLKIELYLECQDVSCQ
ncbi:MAG: hypothetical protein ABIA37_04095 [Candidatus Woesearchaeota archaeon]